MIQKYLILATTDDKYELPICVADSQKELAKILNVDESAVSKKISSMKKGSSVKGVKIYKVPLDEEYMNNNIYQVSILDLI